MFDISVIMFILGYVMVFVFYVLDVEVVSGFYNLFFGWMLDL